MADKRKMPVRKRKGTGIASKGVPWPLDCLRGMILQEAGVTQEQLARLVKEAVAKVKETLKAKETKIATHQGQITDTLDVEDHRVQLAAARLLLELAGVFPSKAESQPQVAPTQINLSVVVPWGAAPRPGTEAVPMEEAGPKREAPGGG